MKVPKSEIYQEYQNILNTVMGGQKNKKKFQSILLAKNLMPSRAFSAVEDREVFEFLNEVELAVILKAASGTIKAHFPFNDVFTEVELNKAEGFSIAISQDYSLPMSFQMSEMQAGKSYVGSISIDKLVGMKESGLLNYNFEIQREAKEIEVSEERLFIPTVNVANVEEIKKLLLEGTLKSTMIVLNIKKDMDSNYINYNNRTGELTIFEGAQIDILDGNHRLNAAAQALSINPDVEFTFALQINYETIEEAQQYQFQLSKATPFSMARKSQLGQEQFGDVITKNVIAHSDLKGKVSTVSQVTKSLGHIVNYKTLLSAISFNFKPANKIEVRKIESTLVDYFDYALALGVIDENSTRLEFYMFVAFVAKRYEQGKEVSENELEKIRDEMNRFVEFRYGDMSAPTGNNIPRSLKKELDEFYEKE